VTKKTRHYTFTYTLANDNRFSKYFSLLDSLVNLQ